MAMVDVIQTGGTLVSPAVPDRSSRKGPLAYTGLFQRRSSRIQVPVKAFLVQAGRHRVLVDAGWGEQCATRARVHLGFALWFASEPVLAPGRGMGPQLAERGVQPGGLDAIVLTHLDCDHASGLSDLPAGTRVFAAAEEIEQSKTSDVRYRPAFWEHCDLRPLPMDDDPGAPFGKSCDLFGDGSFKAVLLPGHSAGSVAVVATSADTGCFAVLAGDTGYNARSWDDLRLPGPLHDADAMRASLEWVSDLRADPLCAGVFAAHDPAIAPGEYAF